MIDLFSTIPNNIELYIQTDRLLLLIIVFIAVIVLATLLYRLMHPKEDDIK